MTLEQRVFPSLFQKGAWAPLRLALRAHAKLDIRGLENLNDIKLNVIFAPNHTSKFDPLLLVASLPFSSTHLPLIFGSREKSYYECKGWEHLVYGGTFFRLMGAHPMYGGLGDYEASLQHHLRFARNGRSICVFPTRLAKEHISDEARGGVIYLSLSTQTPIVPVHIRDVAGLTLGSLVSRKHAISVTFGKPLYPEEIEGWNTLQGGNSRYTAIARELMRHIERLA